jgi:thiamine biosynthesis lipoprotein
MPNLISETRLLWGMPITVAIVESCRSANLADLPSLEVPETSGTAVELIEHVFAYFQDIDEKFSTYKPESEISRINRGVLKLDEMSDDMRTIFDEAERLRLATDGYFNIAHNGKLDPSGLVKGWALANAANLLFAAGCENFYVEAGGDFQAAGFNLNGDPWRVGIRNPFQTKEIVKVLSVSDRGVATSGTYIRGQHIYNPVAGRLPDPEILSITVIGPSVYEADCYATAAFAMGRRGIEFIEALKGFEGYMIDRNKQAAFTRGFNRYVSHANH